VVIRKGSVFVTAGTDRRSSGTHYTPRSLTEPIVQYTLEPLVYVGPAEGKPKEEWKLRPAKELLDLKICDMACGSGAFLVQACRYLSERLLEAWENEEKAEPGRPRIAPEGKRSAGDPTEKILEGVEDREVARQIEALRIVAQRCLYGVDKNPLAVEMAKLSLWLLTLAKDKPFEFLDHAIRCGDSLVGLSNIEQLRSYSLQPDEPNTIKFSGPLDDAVDEAISLRLKLEDLLSNTVEDVERQEKLLKEANEKIARLRCAADLLVAGEFWGENTKDKAERVRHNAVRSGHYVEVGPTEEFEQAAAKERRGQTMFHWPLEFPEVIVKRGGFDAFVGNPPFMGGKKITGGQSSAFRGFLVDHVASGQRGNADICAYFFLRAGTALRKNGCVGLLATNSIAQGETEEVGLRQLCNDGFTIHRAVPSRKWPGDATVEVSHVWLHHGEWQAECHLNDAPVRFISSQLSSDETTMDQVSPLAANAGRSFQGSNLRGIGFVLEPDEALSLIESSPRNKEVVFPYLNGQDLNSRPDQSPSRWVINFFDWDRQKAESYAKPFEIVTARMLPERKKIKHEGTRKKGTEFFWRYDSQAKELYSAISDLEQVIAKSEVGNMLSFVMVPNSMVFSHMLIVFASDDYALLAVLQSNIHEIWARQFGSSMRTDLRYTPKTCFEPFPFPTQFRTLKQVGRIYHETRQRTLHHRQEGLTKTYNRFHDSDETSADIQKLRALHVEMDQAVAAAYDWSDLNLGHGFHETKQGLRYTISEPARREVLQRLLKLNHERYAEEEQQGLHGKKKPKKPTSGRGRKSSASTEGPTLFGNDDDEPAPAEDDAGGEETTTRTARPQRSAPRASREEDTEPSSRPAPIDELDSDDIMAAFRQATRDRGSLERDELMKAVSVVLGYQRLGPKIEEALRGHLRAAIRRRIIEADGASLVRAGTGTMTDYGLDELRETFRSVMRKGTNYEREDVTHALARYLGFARVTDTSRDAIKSAINSAIRQGILGYEGSVVWRED
jgi:hypothetical protein